MIIITILAMLVKLILILLLALIVMLLLILTIPFDYIISGIFKEKASFYLHVHWLFFHVELLLEDMKPFIEVRVFRKIIMNEPIKKRPGKKPDKKAVKSKFKMPGMVFFKEIMNFSKEVLNVIKPKKITAFGYYGLDDPCNTALVSSMIQLFSFFIPQAHIGLAPVFDSETIDLEINIIGRIRLISLVFIFLKYILKKEVRQVVFHKRISNET